MLVAALRRPRCGSARGLDAELLRECDGAVLSQTVAGRQAEKPACAGLGRVHPLPVSPEDHPAEGLLQHVLLLLLLLLMLM